MAKTADFCLKVVRMSLIKRGLLPLGKDNDLAELARNPVVDQFM